MKRVLLVGPSLNAVGGIVSFVQGFLQYDFGEEMQIVYYDTFAPKGRIKHQASKFSLQELMGAFCVFGGFINKIRKNKVQTVVINTSSFWGFWEKAILLIVASLYNKRTVLIIHGGKFVDFLEKSLFSGVIKKLLCLPDKVVFVSKQMKQIVETKVLMNNSVYLPNPVLHPMANFTVEASDLFSELKEYKVRYYIISLLDEVKRIDKIIKAFKAFSYDREDVCLIIAGSGEIEGELREIASNDSNIIFAGELHDSQKAELFDVGDVFVNYSEIESFGISIVESMLCENLIISTRVGILESRCFDREGAIFISSEKELEEAFCSAYRFIVEGKKVGVEVKEFASSFSWNCLGEKYKELL